MIVGLGRLAHDHVAVTDTAWPPARGIIHREDRFGGNALNALATIVARVSRRLPRYRGHLRDR